MTSASTKNTMHVEDNRTYVWPDSLDDSPAWTSRGGDNGMGGRLEVELDIEEERGRMGYRSFGGLSSTLMHQ